MSANGRLSPESAGVSSAAIAKHRVENMQFSRVAYSESASMDHTPPTFFFSLLLLFLVLVENYSFIKT